MTPRRMFAFLELAVERQRSEMARRLIIAALGTSQNEKEIKKALKEWTS